jgi:hypothetical protein
VVRLLLVTSNMAGRMKMDKAAIICKLHEFTDHYLLGAGTR